MNSKVAGLIKNPEFVKKMQACKSIEEAYDVVKELADVSYEEFADDMEYIKNACLKDDGTLLSEDDLQKVAGGASGPIDGTSISDWAAIATSI